MDERRVADYFVVAGMPAHPKLMDVDVVQESNAQTKAPITDLAVIFPPKEEPPDGFTLLEFTPTGIPADLNHGSFRSQAVYLCYRRGYDKPPLVDIGVLYEGKEKIMPDSEIIERSPTGMLANVNNSSSGIFVTYRRAPVSMPCNELVVTDICVIMKNKEEAPPNAFCMIRKSLNRGVLGSDVYLCYKKSMNRANLINYKPEVLTRYPRLDLPSFPFPSSVPMFCLPMGTSLEYWPAKAQRPRPVFSTFVLTVSDASEKVYGSAVTFYERYPTEKVTAQQKKLLQVPEDEDPDDHTFNVNKAICILSHWPFFDTFERFLNYLYSMTGGIAQQVPIERYISFLLEDVPFPSAQRPQLLIQLSPDQRVILTQPEDLPLPRSGARFSKLLVNLAPENCLVVLLCALTEQKLLVHSLRPDVLTGVAEAISMIIFPFKWQCPYIPLCPLGLAEVLHAPLPFLIGVDSRFFDLHEPPIDVICVDLDTNNIIVCEEKRNLTAKLLPKRAARALLSTLEQLHRKLIQTAQASYMQDPARDNCIDRDFQYKRKEQALELEIQEAFLRFMASILKGYRDYLLPITKAPTIGTTDPNSLFDLSRFLRSREKSHHKFFSMVMKTQMFIRFIEERSFVSDMDAGLAFFDECAERLAQDENFAGHLVELDDSLQNERTIYIMPPEPPPNSTTVFCYDTFELNSSLFSPHDAKSFKISSRLSGGLGLGIPGSPMARRTKYEVKSAQKLARKQATTPDMWAKCLLGTCYSIWFIHLPSYVMMNPQKAHACLAAAYDLLDRVQKLNLQPTDEVCYRVMMQLCGVYSAPVLAVKLLFLMKRSGVQLNAITYGFYNRAVLEAQWPSDMRNSSQFLWNKLRNVIMGAALFKQAGTKGQLSRKVSASCLLDGVAELAQDGVSHASSVDSNNSSDLKPTTQSHDDIRQKTGSQSDTGYSSTSDNIKDVGGPSLPEEVDSTMLLDGEAGISGTDVESKAMPSLKTDRGSVEGSRRTSTIVPPSGSAVSNSSIDSTALARFRSRIGSIVIPSSSTSLLAESDLHQQSFESSAGLLMTSRHDSRPIIAEEVHVDEDLSSALVDAKVGSPANARRVRTRSGSCSDFGFAPRLDKSPSIHPLTNSCKAAGEPGSPVAQNPNENLKLLMRSESFAYDAGIISKLNKLALSKGESKAKMNGSSDGQCGNNTRNVQTAFPKASSVSRALFGRRGSSGLRRSQQSESQESSTENLNERSVGNSRGGSMDDLDSVGSQHTTPTRRRLSGWGAQIGAHLGFTSWGSRENMPSSEQRESSPVRSLPKSPARTPVVENDPLGALITDAQPEEEEHVMAENGSAEGNGVLNSALDEDGHPILFGGVGRRSTKPAADKGVSRSATFHEDDSLNTTVGKSGKVPQDTQWKSKSMQRSSTITMPVDSSEGSPGGVAASIGSLSSSFKHPFSRYSPGRFSLRKTNLTFRPMIAAAMSPNNYATKKYPELITGLKSAANNMAKKLSEFKDSMTANNTPLKPGSGLSLDDGSLCEDDNIDYQTEDPGSSRSRKVSSEFSLAVSQNYGEWKSNILDKLNYSSRKGSSSNLQPLGESNPPPQIPVLPENLYPKLPNSNQEPVAMKLLLTSCTRCHNCGYVLYDEEIMAGWSPEDSNLNTRCQFCKKATVPFLTVTVIDNRNLPMVRPNLSQDASQESLHSSPFRKISTSLSPLSASVKRLTTSTSEINDSHASVSESSEVTSPEMETAPTSPITPTAEGRKSEVEEEEKKSEVEEEEKKSEVEEEEKKSEVEEEKKKSEVEEEKKGEVEEEEKKSEVEEEEKSEVDEKEKSEVDEEEKSEDEEEKSNKVEKKKSETKEKKTEEVPLPTSKVPDEPLTLEPITVPYLNPLVLRKELENILHAEGDVTLTRPCFVDEHPIIYWNMVWLNSRIGVESHLPGLCLEAASFLRQREGTPIHSTWTNLDHHNVQVRCMWDNVRLHEEVGLPMYVLWEQNDQRSSLLSALLTERTNVSRGVMQTVVSGIKYSDLSESLKKLTAERQKLKAGCMTRTHSMYRDCLFLAFRVIGQKQILLHSFDAEYERAYMNLSENDLKLPCDEPLSVKSLCCRHYFRELEL